MNRHLLFAIAIALAALGGCDKDTSRPAPAPAPAKASGTHQHADAAPGATVSNAPAGPFRMIVTPEGGLAAATPTSLTLELQDAGGNRIKELDTVHTKLIHLIVVSTDLSSFSHVHPEQLPDGTFRVELTLPHPATYVAFGDFKPTGAPAAISRATVLVSGEPPAAKALEAGPLPARGSFDGFDVSVRSKAPLVAGGDAVLEFEVSDHGAPVSDLQDYLGARGHCVIISEDTTAYLHSHPLGGTGSKVQFHTTLPAAGKYKVWAEFRPGGKRLLASFVIDVPAVGAAPLEEEPDGHRHGGPQGHSH